MTGELTIVANEGDTLGRVCRPGTEITGLNPHLDGDLARERSIWGYKSWVGGGGRSLQRLVPPKFNFHQGSGGVPIGLSVSSLIGSVPSGPLNTARA